MSENLNILEGDLGRQFAPVDRLSVNNQGGGESRWVVADFLDISTLNASENGLYLAAEDDCDCYEEVEVEVSAELEEDDYRKITGKDPNLDPNNDYAVGLDENGNLTKEMIPAAIHIVVPPRKRKYEDGETIDFSGIHVYLMDGNNRRYVDDSYPTGEIPFDELMFPVTVAEGSEGNSTATTDDTGTFPFSTSAVTYTGIDVAPTTPGEFSVGNFQAITALQTYDGGYLWYVRASNTEVSGEGLVLSYTKNGKTVYHQSAHFLNGVYGANPVSNIKAEHENIAWAMIYGDIKSGGTQEIPVQWIRSDGTTLEDTFEVQVGESEEGEDQPDPWAGSADVSWDGHHYNINRRIVPAVHYANGYCWQEGTSEYTVEQAASMGWLILIR